MEKKSDSLNSVEKALKILSTLTLSEEGLGTGELSEQLGFSMPTVSRLLNVLSKHDFVRKGPAGKKYVLGKSAFDVGRFASRHISSQLVTITRPHIDALRDTVEESAMLEVMEGDSMLIIYRASGPHVVSILVKAGTMIPIHASPGGKAMLAFSPPDVVDGILCKSLPRYTHRTITDPDLLKKHFHEIRRNGVAFASGELNNDVNAVGAPIFNHAQKNPSQPLW